MSFAPFQAGDEFNLSVVNTAISDAMADRRTLPVAAGQSVAAGDVVDLNSDGTVGKTIKSCQAIVLCGGTEGQNIEVIFSGSAKLPGMTAGQEVSSPGVYGYCPQDGWIWVKPWWAGGVFHGTYTGDGTASRKIDLGFTPKAVLVFNESGQVSDCIGSYVYHYGGVALQEAPVGLTYKSAYQYVLRIVSGGFQVYYNQNLTANYTEQALTNENTRNYRYIAFR